MPKELKFMLYFEESMDLLPALEEYLINCLIYNNIYHPMVLKEFSQYVDSSTSKEEITNNIFMGKDRIYTDATSIQKVVETMKEIDLEKYYMFIE